MLGGALSLLLGLAAASPILVPTLELGIQTQIQVEVVYAYLGLQDFNQSATGLWRNQADYQLDTHLILYLIVFNVTNRSDRLVVVDQFQVLAAQEISVTYDGRTMGSESLARTHSATVLVNGQPVLEGFSVAAVNTIVHDTRDMRKGGVGWDSYWSPNQTRLIGLSGITDIGGNAYLPLTQRQIYVYAEAEGRPISGGSSHGFSLKFVQLQMAGRDLLYNTVFSENQILRIANGIDVYVVARR